MSFDWGIIGRIKFLKKKFDITKNKILKEKKEKLP